MRVMPTRGMPPRESFQDRVAQEMILRERRCDIATNMYLAQTIAAGYSLNPEVFTLFTLQYRDEVTHANYRPEIIKMKRKQLDFFEKRKRFEANHVKRVETYSIKTQKDLMPYSREELAVLKQKARARALQQSIHKPDKEKKT